MQEACLAVPPEVYVDRLAQIIDQIPLSGENVLAEDQRSIAAIRSESTANSSGANPSHLSVSDVAPDAFDTNNALIGCGWFNWHRSLLVHITMMMV